MNDFTPSVKAVLDAYKNLSNDEKGVVDKEINKNKYIYETCRDYEEGGILHKITSTPEDLLKNIYKESYFDTYKADNIEKFMWGVYNHGRDRIRLTIYDINDMDEIDADPSWEPA